MMLLLLIILLPATAGIASYLIRSHPVRRTLWVVAATAHLVLSVLAAMSPETTPLGHWIGLDALSAIFLRLTSLLFLGATVYGIGYVAREPIAPQPDFEDGSLFKNEPESVFTGGILLLLATMSLAIVSRHLALQWVAIEATTLASAPLIYYHQNRRSLEAAWKYLILCSVGIAVALLGIFFILMAMQDEPRDLTLTALLKQAGTLNHKWLTTAFIFMLVGYGTKMGLAPLHTWLPDAHSEAPSPVSALLSGALLNCAFLGILRVQQVCAAAGMAAFGGDLLVLFGLLSMGVAGVFILRQTDYKRMLAYSSVEHMGILALGVGLGGIGLFGSLPPRRQPFRRQGDAVPHRGQPPGPLPHERHGENPGGVQRPADLRRSVDRRIPRHHGLAAVRDVHQRVHDPESDDRTGTMDRRRALQPVSAAGLRRHVRDRPAHGVGQVAGSRTREPWTTVLPPLVFALLALLLGVYLPAPLADKLHDAAQLLGGPAK